MRVGIYPRRIGADAALCLRVFLLNDGAMLCVKDTILLRKNEHGPGYRQTRGCAGNALLLREHHVAPIAIQGIRAGSSGDISGYN